MGDEMAHTDYPRWPLPDEPGRVLFDRYELIERIGEGAMAVVWRVLRLDLGCERALKLIRPEIAQNDRAWQRLEREARLLAQLSHPHVVVIYDFKRDHGIGYIEMELVPGRSLAEILKERRGQPMPLDWTIRVCEQLCSALQAAHCHVDAQTGKLTPIIHRDLKPSNLMLVKRTRTEEPSYLVVLDFGIARMLENDGTTTMTAAGDLVSSPAYMSPEQIAGGFETDGRRHDIDVRSDLYSTGVVLYQLLTGSLPFRGTTMAIMAAHLTSPPLPMKKANPAVAVLPEVERAVMQCLEKDPRKRPRSAAELARLVHPRVQWGAASPAPGRWRAERKPTGIHQRRARPAARWSASPFHGLGSLVRHVLDFFHRSEAATTAARPTIEDDESRSKARDQPMASEPPPPRPRSGIEPTSIRRHTDVSFPAVVQAGKVYNLRIQLVPAEEALPSGEVRERPRPHAHDATLNLLVAPPTKPDTPPPPVKLTISVAAENFEIEGLSRVEIVVPLAGKSPAVQFSLQGMEAGPGRIMVDFAQDGRPAGSVDLMPEVVADIAALPRPGGLAPPSGELSLSLGVDPAVPPDVVLKVFEHRMAGHPGRLQFVLSSNHRALADLPVLDGDLGTLDLRTDVAGWVGEQLRAVGDLATGTECSADNAARTMAAVGFNLFQQLLPPAVQELSWTLRQRGVKTLLILSDDPHIPWELIKPFRADPVSGLIVCEDAFWGESYAMAHWLRGRPPVPRLTIARVLGVAACSSGPAPSPVPESSISELDPGSTRDMVRIDTSTGMAPTPTEPEESGVGHYGLDTYRDIAGGDEELALLRSFEALGARVERLPALRRALRQAFEEGSFDLLHLISHGSFGGLAGGDASAVFLDDGAFTAAELSPLMAAALRRAAPLVMFNTCHCGRIGFSLSRLGSWGAHLVQLGCGGFVGALWPVSDRAALAFARAFYEQLARRCPLGEAMRLARLSVREQYPGDPTWLAYCCFADPMAQVEARAENHVC